MATVLIWNNNKVTLGGNDYSGHASMCIDDNWQLQSEKNYVSFWPEQGAGMLGSAVSERGGSVRYDVKEERYAPDHVIRLSNLNASAMKATWLHTRNEFKKYQYLRQNCSTAVARVLRAGSSSGSAYDRHSAIWTPLKVKRLALAMGGTKIGWNDLVQELSSAGAISGSDITAMSVYGKRDARHGSSTTISQYAGGKRLMARPEFQWKLSAMNIGMSGGAIVDTRGQMNAMFDTFDADDAD